MSRGTAGCAAGHPLLGGQVHPHRDAQLHRAVEGTHREAGLVPPSRGLEQADTEPPAVLALPYCVSLAGLADGCEGRFRPVQWHTEQFRQLGPLVGASL